MNCKKEFKSFTGLAKYCSIKCNKRVYAQSHKKERKTYYQKTKEKILEMNRNNYIRHRAKYLDQKKEYYEKNKEKIKKYKLDYVKKRIKVDATFRKKINSRRYANYISIKGCVCDECGTKQKLQRHHSDYNKPRQIIILCRKHHGEIHGARC